MKKLLKITTFFNVIFFNLITSVYATGNAEKIKNYFINGTTHEPNFNSLGNTIFTLFMVFGYAIALCMVVVTGLKFLTANGQQRAQLKEKLWLIVLGVAVLVAGIPALSLIANLMYSMFR